MIITVYRDGSCTDILGSGIVGEYRALIYAGASAHDTSSTFTLDGKQYPVRQIWHYSQSTVYPESEPTKIQMDDIHDDNYHYLYLTPNLRIRYKMNRNSIHNYYLYWHSWQWKNPTTNEWTNLSAWYESPITQMYEPPEICFRTAETAQNASTTHKNYLCIDVTYKNSTGVSTITERASFGFSNFDILYDVGYESGKYKPKTGNTTKRAGTGTGRYPNNRIPALPTASINAAFSAILGRGDGLTYYRLDGDCMQAITEFLYDTTLTLKFRNSQFRDAIASLVFIPFNVTANVTNTLRTIYLANKPIYPNSACDIITEPLREIDFGVIDLSAADIGYKTFADYTQTTATLYLPCYGAVNVAMQNIANGLLFLSAVLDVRNGNILYRLETQGQDDETPVLYGQYTGNCGIPVPVGGANASPTVLGAIASIGTVATGVATGNPLSIVGGVSSLAQQTAPTIDKSGAMQPQAAAIGTPVPVLQIAKHIMLQPPKWGEINGYPSAGMDTDEQYTLSEFSGYFQAAYCDVSGIDGATDAEKAEIEQLLKGGVFL